MCDSPHLARHLRLVAAGVLLVAVVAAVEVSVADLVAGDPEAALALLEVIFISWNEEKLKV